MNDNKPLHVAKRNAKDEFWTTLEEIEREVPKYAEYLKGKKVISNCDNPFSNFTKYFLTNFKALGLKQFIAIGRGFPYYIKVNEDGNSENIPLNPEDTDFRSELSRSLVEESDIVITNPPFPLFREYLKIILNKQFLILANKNAITYKEVFPLIKENKLWLGYRNGEMEFEVPRSYSNELSSVFERNHNYFIRLRNLGWFTNLPVFLRDIPLKLNPKCVYDPALYSKYDNYDAINVDKVANIPIDYDGVVGVPITFLEHYCPQQFEIVKFRKGNDEKDLSIGGKCPYFRILIKRL